MAAATFSVLRESLSGHQQKPSDYWWGRLRVQLHACMGRSEEWLELRWAKHSEKCSLVRLQIRREVGGGQVLIPCMGKPAGTLYKELKENNWWRGGLFVCFFRMEKVPNKANSSLIRVKSGILWHLAPFFYFSDGPNCRHIPNCTGIIMSEPGLLIGPGSSQWKGRKWVTGLSALTWYFTWRRSEPASHYLSNTVYNWGSLCPVKSSSQGVPLYLGSATQR